MDVAPASASLVADRRWFAFVYHVVGKRVVVHQLILFLPHAFSVVVPGRAMTC